MIAKLTQGGYFAGVVNYVFKKDAKLIHSEGVMTKDKESIIQSFVLQSKLNEKVSKPVAHISLNFSKQDKKKLSNELMLEIAKQYIEKMGYGNTQYIAVRHFDTEHDHLHLILNRVGNDGKRISDKNELIRNKNLCKSLTKDYNLYFSSGKENVKQYRLKEPDKSKYEIYYSIKSSLRKSNSWNDLIEDLKKKGIKTELKYDNDKKKYKGVIFSKNGYHFGGSKIDREFSFHKLNQQFEYDINRTITRENEYKLHKNSEKSFSLGELIMDTVEVITAPTNTQQEENNLNKKTKTKFKR